MVVAVTGIVRGVQRPRDLRPDVRRQRLGHQIVAPPGQLERRPQGAPVDELEDEDGTFGFRFLVVDCRDDSRVVQQADKPRLVREHARHARIAATFRREHLDDHPAAKCACAFQLGKPHFAHAAEAEPIDEHITAADAVALTQLTHVSRLKTGLLQPLTCPCTYLLYPPQRGKSRE